MDHPQFDVGQKPGPFEQPPENAYYVEPPPKGRGCLFYGCLAAGVAGLLGLVVIGGTAYMAWYYYSRLVDEYTASAPMDLPKVEATEERVADVETRWNTFKDALDKGEEAEIILDQDDVNILASREPDLKDHVYFTLEDDKAKVELSFDLSKTNLPRTKGRFFNAKATVTAEVNQSGRMDVRLLDIEVAGKPLPEEVSKGIGAENLADSVVKNRDNREFMDKIERVEVKDSKVYIKTRALPKPTEKGKESPGDEPAPETKEATEPAKDAPKADEPPPPATETPAEPAKEDESKKAA
ncbi:MAG: hypothetical protein AB7I30_19070 [Isosphaeraceae bacterium]